jgi:hypothetical protein
MNGHLAQKCPNKTTSPGVGNQSRPQGQQKYANGKVNHVTTEEAQDVVLVLWKLTPCNNFI